MPILSFSIFFAAAAAKVLDHDGIMLQFADEFSLTARRRQCDDYINNFADNSVARDLK
jgi:hypothetical protein